MIKTYKTDRRICRIPDSSILITSSSSRRTQTIVDTPRQVRLIRDVEVTVDKLSRTELFKTHNITKATGYRILKLKSPRRNERSHNRGRKSVLVSYQCDTIKTIENSSFQFRTLLYITITKAIGLANGSERAIQKNMAKYDVDTYMVQQKKFISATSIEKRGIWGFERRYWHLDDFKRYKYSDESHFACALQRQARIHRRRDIKARDASTKIQFRFKRRNQVWHVFAYIGWNFKSKLHFYTGSGGEERLTQADYVTILEEVIVSNWDPNWILLENNDNVHDTRDDANNKCKQTKKRLEIKCESNPPQSPDLNPIESIWRMIK